ncbi:MAG: UMP kinase [Bacilli bacterium]
MKYKRVLLKLSGEALKVDNDNVISPDIIFNIAKEVKELYDIGVEIAIVVGGGNIWRGKIASDLGMDRSTADYMGMLATMMNGLAISDGLNSENIENRVMTSIESNRVAEPYIRGRALKHLENNRVVIFVGGTGSPYFSTDSASCLRAAEINADVILMAKNYVDGVYDSDPKINSNAKKFQLLSYDEMVFKELKVMDLTAVTLGKENDIPIIVFNLNEPGNILRVVKGENIGTTIKK